MFRLNIFRLVRKIIYELKVGRPHSQKGWKFECLVSLVILLLQKQDSDNFRVVLLLQKPH